MKRIFKNRLSLVLFNIFIILIVLTSITYAWIIYEKKTQPIDVSSNGIKYVYKIDDDLKTTSTVFSITDLAFFDISEGEDVIETKFFLDMAKIIEIDIINTGDLDITYQLALTSGKYTVNYPGVLVIFTDKRLTLEDIDINESLQTVLSSYQDTISDSLAKFNKLDNNQIDNSTKIYAYIIGVQLDDDSDNEFLNNTYNFTLTLTATN